MKQYLMVERKWLEKVLNTAADKNVHFGCDGECSAHSANNEFPNCIDCLPAQMPNIINPLPPSAMFAGEAVRWLEHLVFLEEQCELSLTVYATPHTDGAVDKGAEIREFLSKIAAGKKEEQP